MTKYLLTLLFCIQSIIIFGQHEEFVIAFSDSMKNIQTLDYKVSLWTKKMSSDVFTERKFHLFAKRNPLNKGYIFDWEIIEYRDNGTWTDFFIGADWYFASHEKKKLIKHPDIVKWGRGYYNEFVRSTTLFDEVIYNFESAPSNLESVEFPEKKDKEFVQVHFKISDNADRYLLLQKETLFPIQTKDVLVDRELNLEQIFKSEVSNLKINSPLPDTVLNLQFYLDKGFEIEEKKEEELVESEFKLTGEQVDLFFQTPLVRPSGDSITLNQIDAEYILVDFWFLACQPCRESFPHLQELSDKYKGKGLEVVGVNFNDTASKEFASSQLIKSGFTYSNLFSNVNLRNKLGVFAFPSFIIFDKNQEVIYTRSGYSKEAEEEISSIFESAFKE